MYRSLAIISEKFVNGRYILSVIAFSFSQCDVVFLCIAHQVEIVFTRDGGGLGISIAGGKGSTPYKGNDEVSDTIDV